MMQVKIRLPDDVHEKLKRRAHDQNQSVASLVATFIEKGLGVAPATKVEQRPMVQRIIDYLDANDGWRKKRDVMRRFHLSEDQLTEALREFDGEEYQSELHNFRAVSLPVSFYRKQAS